MARLFVNPKLPDYFLEAAEVRSAATARSYVSEYEAGKVITFPNLRMNIDHDLWAALDTDQYPGLKKFGIGVNKDNHGNVDRHRSNLLEQGIDGGLVDALCEQFQTIYNDLIPVYRAIYSDYAFDKQKVVWRLNTIMNENMHFDAYKQENDHHFARLFVNLDTQPRIWQTSWPIGEALKLLNGRLPKEFVRNAGRAKLWMEMNDILFGRSSREWWDDEPRHVLYFAPGDVWAVDSRQIAHQIFFGRRALSIDFSLPKESMKDPSRHYLVFADRFREQQLAGTAIE